MALWFKLGVLAFILALVFTYAPLQSFYATSTGSAIKNVFNHSDFISRYTGNSTVFTITGSAFIIGAIIGLVISLVFRNRKTSSEIEESENLEESEEIEESEETNEGVSE